MPKASTPPSKTSPFLTATLVFARCFLSLFLLTLSLTAHAQLTYKVENGAITITGALSSSGTLLIALNIPETIDGLPVRAIGNSAFYGRTDISDVSIPNSVTSIGNLAFYYCRRLTSLGIPNSVTSIGDQAFWFCTGLTSVSIPNSVTSIGQKAFYQCTGLTSLRIGNSVTSIGDLAFAICTGLTDFSVDGANPSFISVNGVLFNKTQTILMYSVNRGGTYTIPNSVTEIRQGAFVWCTGLSSVSIPNSVTSIGDYAFDYCTNLTSVSIGNSVTSIGDYAFTLCTGLTSLSIPNSVTSIGDSAFALCSGLTSLRIGNSVTSIGDYAFNSCTGLTSLSIPNSLTSIGAYAFDRCTGLTGVYFDGDQPGSDSSAFGPPITLYHLPGKTGWGATFSGRPTVLWNPSAPTQDPAFGVRDGKFGFKITGNANIPVVVEACDSLTLPLWLPVSTNTLTGGSSSFTDPTSTNHPSRIYRFRSQ